MLFLGQASPADAATCGVVTPHTLCLLQTPNIPSGPEQNTLFALSSISCSPAQGALTDSPGVWMPLVTRNASLLGLSEGPVF